MYLNDILTNPLKNKKKDECFYWDKKINFVPESFDLRDVFLSWEVSNLEELSSFLGDELYKKEKAKIKNCLKSYKTCGINYSKYNFSSIFPVHVWAEFIKAREGLLWKALAFLQEKPYFEEVKDFFVYKSNTHVKNYFNFDIQTANKKEKIDLDFGLNFRFKARPNTLNIFNMAKFFRKNIIPLDKDSIIYACDFKQFEFRTYLDIHPEIDIDFNETNLYDSFAQKYIPEVKDHKVSIIAYLYGKQNYKLDSVLKKDSILDKIEYGEIFWHKGMPVILDKNKPDNKKVHSIVQTISQYRMLKKINNILNLLKDYESVLLYPFHDELIFSLKKEEEKELLPKIVDILSDKIYKVHQFKGPNFLQIKEV